MTYWEERYKHGGSSGKGSVGELKKRKWEVIKTYLQTIDDVIDVGCGDLSFWEGYDCKHYIGIDISQTIINRNKIKKSHWNFICSDIEVYQPILARIVFCFDVLFHINDDIKYDNILINLTRYSKEWLFISTWYSNPIRKPKYIFRQLKKYSLKGLRNVIRSCDEYQKYRVFDVKKISEQGFILLGIHKLDDVNAMYVFKRIR